MIVSATRSITWRSDHSRSGVPSVPRKYFWATMFVAFSDQLTSGTRRRAGRRRRCRPCSSGCARRGAPTRPCRTGATPGVVKCRRIPIPSCCGAIAMGWFPPRSDGRSGSSGCAAGCVPGVRTAEPQDVVVGAALRPRDGGALQHWSHESRGQRTSLARRVLVRGRSRRFALVHACTRRRGRRLADAAERASGAVVFWSSPTSRSKSARSSKPL